MTAFTALMRREADPIFEAIYRHPYVQGIGKGDLSNEQLIHYVKQDFEYLNVYMQVYGLGISKCADRRDIAMFHEKIGFILNSEVHPHNNFCRKAGVKYEDLQGYPLAPTAVHYTRHMLAVAHNGTLGELLAVMLACPWTYLEIGQRLIEDFRPTQDHPFYDWIMFYGDQPMVPRIQSFLDRIDRWVEEGASASEKARMMDHFLKSCQLEYMFFDMAYKLEEWPVQSAPAGGTVR